jgi:hypothetical protein
VCDHHTWIWGGGEGWIGTRDDLGIHRKALMCSWGEGDIELEMQRQRERERETVREAEI